LAWTSRLLVLLLFIHGSLLAWAATRHSPTIDEVGHLAAGLNHWQTGAFDLYRVNPPLVRTVATLPLALKGIKAPEPTGKTAPPHRPEFELGRQFVRDNGERAFRCFTVARWACLPFALLGLYVCYRWARDLYGPWAGLLAGALWCFCPNVLANGQMITPDTGAAAFGLAACYLFWRWLRAPSWGRALAAGVTLGLAELCKASWVLLFPLWPLLWALWRVSRRPAEAGRSWRREGLQLSLALFLALDVLNLGYGFEGTGEALGRLRFVSQALSREGKAGERENRFAGTGLGDLPVPLPRNYVEGIDVQKRDFERGFQSYLRGEWRHGGWWYYYLYGLGVKLPLGTLLLLLLALLSAAAARGAGPGWRAEAVLLAPGLLLLALVSSQTGFNHHLRYALPALPFLFVWAGRAAALAPARPRAWGALVGGALACSAAGSLAVYPHSLSYFNALAGGPLRGSEHLVDSNVDWGQDLLYLRRWLEGHPEAKPLGLAYFGFVDPRAAGIHFALPPRGPTAAADRVKSGYEQLGPKPGWYAVSVTLLRGYSYPVPDGTGRSLYLDQPYYEYFQRFRPVATAGYSIFIYHLEREDCDRVRAELGLPPVPERALAQGRPGPAALPLRAAAAATPPARAPEPRPGNKPAALGAVCPPCDALRARSSAARASAAAPAGPTRPANVTYR
jgi:4-amino-4-deoxy-L-arabinose transferase-like glycosyltransferase